jgi:hypothetical protein
MPTMIVRVNLKEGVSPEEYGPWILVLRPGGDGPPFSRRLARLQGSWSARVAHPSYQYVVTLEIKDPKQP